MADDGRAVWILLTETAAVRVPAKCDKIPDAETTRNRPALREQCHLPSEGLRCQRETVNDVGCLRVTAQLNGSCPNGL